jgi:hypothetical protein
VRRSWRASNPHRPPRRSLVSQNRNSHRRYKRLHGIDMGGRGGTWRDGTNGCTGAIARSSGRGGGGQRTRTRASRERQTSRRLSLGRDSDGEAAAAAAASTARAPPPPPPARCPSTIPRRRLRAQGPAFPPEEADAQVPPACHLTTAGLPFDHHWSAI